MGMYGRKWGAVNTSAAGNWITLQHVTVKFIDIQYRRLLACIPFMLRRQKGKRLSYKNFFVRLSLFFKIKVHIMPYQQKESRSLFYITCHYWKIKCKQNIKLMTVAENHLRQNSKVDIQLTMFCLHAFLLETTDVSDKLKFVSENKKSTVVASLYTRCTAIAVLNNYTVFTCLIPQRRTMFYKHKSKDGYS
jgi:hypothetical protein